MARKRTVDDSVAYWFPWKHPMARRRWLEFGIFDQTPPKMGLSARPYRPRCSIVFPPQNYNSQSIGSTLRASPFASFGTFARKHNPNVGLALRASPFERRKCTRRQFFTRSMSISRSRTCCARLRPRRVLRVVHIGLHCLQALYCMYYPASQRQIMLVFHDVFVMFLDSFCLLYLLAIFCCHSLLSFSHNFSVRRNCGTFM